VREKIAIWIAWHLPKSIAKWAAIRIGAHATAGAYESTETPALLFVDAMKRWESA